MGERVSQLLDLFDTLPDPDKQLVLSELLRRDPPGEADIRTSAFDALADELFAALDAEEAACATDR